MSDDEIISIPSARSDEEPRLIDACWRAPNYLSVDKIYLLLLEPLRLERIKPQLLGHRGTTAELAVVYSQMDQEIRARDLNAIFVAAAGHAPSGAALLRLELTARRLAAGPVALS